MYINCHYKDKTLETPTLFRRYLAYHPTVPIRDKKVAFFYTLTSSATCGVKTWYSYKMNKMKLRMNKWMNARKKNEWMKKRMNEWVNQWVKETKTGTGRVKQWNTETEMEGSGQRVTDKPTCNTLSTSRLMMTEMGQGQAKIQTDKPNGRSPQYWLINY